MSRQNCRPVWLLLLAASLPAASIAQVRVARTITALSPTTIPPAQSTNVQVPIVGFVTTDSGSALRPIFGIPGAALLGAPIALPGQTQKIAIAPSQSFALVELGNAAGIGLLPLAATGVGTILPISGTLAQPDLVRFSPGGSTAILYSKKLASAQVVTGLPGSPRAAAELALSALDLPVSALAVSDDGKAVLVGTSDGQKGELTIFFGNKSPALMTSLGQPSALKFLPKSYEAFLTDALSNRLFALDNVTGAFNARELATKEDGLNVPQDFEVSPDQTKLFVANSGNNTLLSVGISTTQRVSIPCPVIPSSIVRVSAGPVYLISSTTLGAFAIMESGPGTARVSFVPSLTASAGQPLK